MAWSDYTISANVLRGLARHDSALIDGDDDGQPAVSRQIVEAAKELVIRKVTKKKEGARLVLGFGTVTEFFDEVASQAAAGQPIERQVEQMVGYAYLFLRAESESLGVNHHQYELGQEYERALEEAVMSFCNLAPSTVTSAAVTVVESKTVSVRSSATWDPDA